MTNMDNTSDTMDRFYIRCAHCLSIGVVGSTEGYRHWHCNLCAGSIEVMGKVVQDKKVQVESERSACDKRCTHAIGPVCVCKCACANHGTGRTVTVVTVQDIPQVQFVSDEVAVANAKQFTLDVATLKVEVQNIERVAREASQWRWELYNKARTLKQLLGKAIEARTWKSRHQKVAQAKALVAPQEVAA